MLLIEMFKRNLFEPMNVEMMNKLDYSYKYKDENFNYSRLIKIAKQDFSSAVSNKVKYGKWLFGFDTSEYCVDVLMNNLQNVVNRIVAGVNVRCNTKYSVLMQRIMFEY